MVEKVSPGQRAASTPLRKAAFINDTIDAVNYFKERRLGEPSQVLYGQISTDIIKVQNDTGGDLSAGSVIQLGDYLLDQLDRRNIWFSGDTPADEERIAILGVPIASKKIGIAHVSGVCVATVNVTNTNHTRATAKSSSDVLHSGISGQFRILSSIDSTGEQDVVVLFESTGIAIYRYTLTEDMGATTPQQASCTIYTIDGNDVTEHATDETVYDPWPVFDGGESGQSGPCIKQGGKYYTVNLSCGEA